MAFDNNQFSHFILEQPNAFANFTAQQRDLCLTLGCVDATLLPSEDQLRQIALSQVDPEGKYLLEYQHTQRQPLNQQALNLFRVFASDERAPGRLG